MLVGTDVALFKGMVNKQSNQGDSMCKVTLKSGEVIEAKVVKAVRSCPSHKMAVWYVDNVNRCTTAVVRISRGN